MSEGPQPGTVLDRVLASIANGPSEVAFVAGEQALRYRDLLLLWAAGVEMLQARGIGPGRRVALTMGQSPVQVAMLLAIARLGALVVPVSPFLGQAQRSDVFRKLGLEAVVADRPEYAPPGVPLVLVPQLATASSPAAVHAAGPWPGPEGPFMLSLTSGTTGLPKAIAHTHGSFVRRVARNLHGVGTVPRLLPPGLHIIPALSGVFHALFETGAVVLPRDSSAVGMLDAIRRHAVTSLMMPPANLGNLARASASIAPSLRQVRFLGGTPSAAVVASCCERLTPNLLTVYASVETSTVAYADAEVLARAPTSAGRVCDDTRIEVVDDEGRALPQGRSGRLRIQVPVMPEGYFGPDAGDRSRFRDGWYYSADVGRFADDGLLYVEGRVDDVINLGGRKFLPVALETLLEEFPGVREAAVYLPPGAERVEAAVVAEPSLDTAALARHCAERLELLAPARIHRVDALPRNSMGKLEREKLGR